MDFMGTILQFFECVGPPIRQYVRRHRKLSEIMKNLERPLQELNCKKADIEATLKAECDLGNKQPSNEVNDWLENVERINSEAHSFEEEVKKGKYFSRARLGKHAEEKIQEVKEYHQKACSFTSLVIAPPPTGGLTLTTATLAGEKTKKVVERIWEDLMGDKVTKIGVWGMGGIGKTTIMKEINNRLQKETNKFNVVIWVTVSQPLDLIKLQNEIAAALNQSLPENEDEVRRAGRLSGMLKAKAKFVLILDDMWKEFRLEEVGIPEPSEENGCKLVITTRSLGVCRFMDCKEIGVELLSQEEALNLFLDKVRISTSQILNLDKEIINSVVEECAGLPLAIVTVASCMRGVDEIHEWRNALNELRGLVRSRNGVNADVLGRLEFSYHRLKDDKVQQCFLYCALYPEDFAIPKEELIDYWIVEGFIEEVKDVQAKNDRGHTILNRLVNCCLLESAKDGRCVKMHDLIRDMALSITSESPLFMAKAGLRLQEFPVEQEWKENLERVSLMKNNIKEIPSYMSPHCDILSTLLLQANGNLWTIPECFFVHMHGLKDLMGDKVSKIGVWGMGGIGKTTIMSHINNKLQEKPNKFNDVIWVTVSQPLDLFKLQTEIATALKQSLPENEDKVRRAGRLLGMLKAKEKFVLILDDMWEAFPLQEIGIPEPSEENGCKLVITTRLYRVCRSMKCKQVAVELLSKQEAFNLFIDGVGSSILQVPILNKEIINEVVEECGCLPLAIVTVAASMSGEEEIYEWQNALNELRGRLRSLNDVDTKVFGRLEFSYHRLKDEKLQQCFLYCAQYPEDFAIPKDKLIDYWIAEGFIDEVKDVPAKYDRGHTILNRLVNCCLLESAEDDSCVKMHDLIRDMALRITSKSPLFMVKAGLRLLKFPSEQEWEENLERVSLMENEIEEIPSNMSPHCEILSTLLLQRNKNLQRIPECFFVHMHGLKVLNLSHTDIEVLPSSISDLTNLRSLLLRWCGRLKRVPSLAKLLALQYLDLEGTWIEEVPEGMEMLENLSYLYLYSLPLKKFPTGILPRLRDLYKLKLSFGREALRETVEEAARLSDRLDTFEGHFSTLKDFNIYVKSTDGRGSKNYCLLLWPSGMRGFLITDLEVDKSVSVHNCKICEREEPIVLPEDVPYLTMFAVDDVASLNDVLPREQGLVNIGKFSHGLKVLRFGSCHNLKNLFSLRLLPALQNLEVLEVNWCISIEEIVAVEDEETEKELATNTIINTVTLPRLKRLGFYFLPEFKSFCSNNGVLVCNSLQEIEVRGCPKLKRLSLSLPLLDNGQPSPPAALKVIEIKKELWETLEWDQANAKDVLNPYCNFNAY